MNAIRFARDPTRTVAASAVAAALAVFASPSLAGQASRGAMSADEGKSWAEMRDPASRDGTPRWTELDRQSRGKFESERSRAEVHAEVLRASRQGTLRKNDAERQQYREFESQRTRAEVAAEGRARDPVLRAQTAEPHGFAAPVDLGRAPAKQHLEHAHG